MHGPVVVAWVLTAVFLLITFPCVHRLVSLDYGRLGAEVRHGDLAELMFVLGMVAMFSPVGGPIPVAGWQVVFGGAAVWFAVSWWRSRRAGRGHELSAHHAVSAVVMLYMVTAMPHDTATHGPWLNMSTMDGSAWPPVAVLGAVYFFVDAARSGLRAIRPGDPGPREPGLLPRTASRSIMGLGMGYMLLVAL
ncbi:DUF5134 domain-containing protein [Amycolatopsis anabasis]|uniref:DUF5134 domain-containing protein n=1 Tax=Amycolatopsis anabasis TaxID=1840409 RepID=UPI00131DE2AF|nr:DUF5134 domain-containing protein [Amycolatopsis anabasis]